MTEENNTRTRVTAPVGTEEHDLPFEDYCERAGDCRACKGVNCTCSHHAAELPVDSEFGPRSRVDDWPIADVLGHLASATEHLLRDHNCDEDGWEIWKYAAEAAWKHVALLNKPATTPPAVTSQVQCADCLAWIDRDVNHTCRQQVRRNQRNRTK